MRSRGLVVALALLLAIGATAAVFLYVNGVKENAVSNGDLETVVVSTQNIAANADLSALRAQGVFELKQIPADTKLESAVTDPGQLDGKTATSPILAGEQIPLERLSGGQTDGAFSRLGICSTCVAITVRVDGPPGVGGEIQRGDFVTLYATFSGLATFRSAKDLVAAVQTGASASGGGQGNQVSGLPPFTMTLMPTIKVLKVENPSTPTTTETQSDTTSEGNVTLTLDVPREEAEFVIFGNEQASLYFGLLPPDQEGLQLPAQAVSIDRIIGKKQS